MELSTDELLDEQKALLKDIYAGDIKADHTSMKERARRAKPINKEIARLRAKLGPLGRLKRKVQKGTDKALVNIGKYVSSDELRPGHRTWDFHE